MKQIGSCHDKRNKHSCFQLLSLLFFWDKPVLTSFSHFNLLHFYNKKCKHGSKIFSMGPHGQSLHFFAFPQSFLKWCSHLSLTGLGDGRFTACKMLCYLTKPMAKRMVPEKQGNAGEGEPSFLLSLHRGGAKLLYGIHEGASGKKCKIHSFKVFWKNLWRD